MKKYIAFIVSFAFVFCLISSFCFTANADAFTAMQIGAAAYATMSSWGIAFQSQNATAMGMGDYMAIQIQDFVNQRGGSIADVFGGSLAVDLAGKLVVGHQMYNALIDFKDWMVAKYSLTLDDFSLTDGTFEGRFIPYDDRATTDSISGVGIEVVVSTPRGKGYRSCRCYLDGVLVASRTLDVYYYSYSGNYSIEYSNGIVRLMMEVIYTDSGDYSQTQAFNIATQSNFSNGLSWNGSNYVAPTVIDPGYEWLGTVGDYQDTNLEQLLQHILDDVEGNNLLVDGDVLPIDPPQPEPTPIPIDPGTPLVDVPWEGLDTNLQNLYNQGLEEIGAIDDAQDAITDAIADQTGALEGAISDNAGVVSGAIDQAVSDIQDAISEQTNTLSESASATAAATESIAEALEDEDIDWQKFDLRVLFPFCIPFDIYNMLEALDASPTAPHVQLPFVIESIGFSYTLDLDFSAFDQVAAVMRQMELLVYGIALAWATSKVIKW